MSRILGRDPTRRCKRVSEWPEGDRVRRTQALMSGDVIEEGGSLADYSVWSIRCFDAGYGRWLQWLDIQRDELDPAASPAARVTRQRVAAYVEDLLQFNGTKTIMGRLNELYHMCRALDPGHPLHWLPRMSTSLRARHVPVRLKAPRLVGVDELFQLGLRLMKQAAEARTTRRQALQYPKRADHQSAGRLPPAATKPGHAPDRGQFDPKSGRVVDRHPRVRDENWRAACVPATREPDDLH